MKVEDLFPRRCDVTNEGMHEGWVWGDGAFYTAYEEDALKEAKKDEEHIIEALINSDYEAYNEPFGDEIEVFDNIVKKVKAKEPLTDRECLILGYHVEYVYWTEWEEYMTYIKDQEFGYDENGEEYNLFDDEWVNVKELKTFKVEAEVTTYCTTTIVARNEEEAFHLSSELDGGDFVTEDNTGNFHINSVTEVKD